VPPAVGARISELEFVNTDALRKLRFAPPSEADRSHVLDCMRTAVKYQEESMGVLRSMLEQGGRGMQLEVFGADHSSQVNQHMNLFEI
jgi:hypothetical protein